MPPEREVARPDRDANSIAGLRAEKFALHVHENEVGHKKFLDDQITI